MVAIAEEGRRSIEGTQRDSLSRMAALKTAADEGSPSQVRLPSASLSPICLPWVLRDQHEQYTSSAAFSSACMQIYQSERSGREAYACIH